MKTLLITSLLLINLSPFILAQQISTVNDQNFGADILVYADKPEVAEKVASYLQDQDLNAMPISDPLMMNYNSLKNIKVIVLVPLKSPLFPDNVLINLKNYVYKGGNIIGLHDVILSQPILSEIFGGNAGTKGYQQIGQNLTINVRDQKYTQIIKDIPDSFMLANEHSFGTVYKPTVHRLFEEYYTSHNATKRRYCAGWLHDYGKGKALYFSPGDAEETRYDPNVSKLIGNTAGWMLQAGNESIVSKGVNFPNTASNQGMDKINPMLLSPDSRNEYIKGKMEGSMLAKGNENWGCAGLFGILGVAFAYTFPTEPPATYMVDKTPEYTYGFTEGYRSQSQSKNAGYALTGWLISWAALVLFVFMGGS